MEGGREREGEGGEREREKETGYDVIHMYVSLNNVHIL